MQKAMSGKEFVAEIHKTTGYALSEKTVRDWKKKGLDHFLNTKRTAKSVGSGRKTPFEDVGILDPRGGGEFSGAGEGFPEPQKSWQKGGGLGGGGNLRVGSVT